MCSSDLQARLHLVKLMLTRRDPAAERVSRAVEAEARSAGLVAVLKELGSA
mgnify:CR=1 FL=1